MCHWHTHEDEFCMCSRASWCCAAAREQLLTAGMCAGFAAGAEQGHQLINRSDRPARYLEVSNRDAADTAHYSDPE